MGLSHLPSCFESVLGVQVESVQGNQAYLEWLGKSGSFPIEVCLLGCTRVSRLDQPPLEGNSNIGSPFPFPLWQDPRGSTRDSVGDTDLLLWCEGKLAFLLS